MKYHTNFLYIDNGTFGQITSKKEKHHKVKEVALMLLKDLKPNTILFSPFGFLEFIGCTLKPSNLPIINSKTPSIPMLFQELFNYWLKYPDIQRNILSDQYHTQLTYADSTNPRVRTILDVTAQRWADMDDLTEIIAEALAYHYLQKLLSQDNKLLKVIGLKTILALYNQNSSGKIVSPYRLSSRFFNSEIRDPYLTPLLKTKRQEKNSDLSDYEYLYLLTNGYTIGGTNYPVNVITSEPAQNAMERALNFYQLHLNTIKMFNNNPYFLLHKPAPGKIYCTENSRYMQIEDNLKNHDAQ